MHSCTDIEIRFKEGNLSQKMSEEMRNCLLFALGQTIRILEGKGHFFLITFSVGGERAT